MYQGDDVKVGGESQEDAIQCPGNVREDKVHCSASRAGHVKIMSCSGKASAFVHKPSSDKMGGRVHCHMRTNLL